MDLHIYFFFWEKKWGPFVVSAIHDLGLCIGVCLRNKYFNVQS